MNRLTKTFLILLQLGGGFMGFALSMQSLLRDHEYVDDFLAFLFGISIFTFGIYAGFAVIKNADKAVRLSIIYHLLQIPYISLAFFQYGCYSGFTGTLLLNQDGLGPFIMIGSAFEFGFLGFGSPTVGINIFAVAILFLLIKIKKRQNQNIEPIVTTPVESGKAQSTQAHV